MQIKLILSVLLLFIVRGELFSQNPDSIPGRKNNFNDKYLKGRFFVTGNISPGFGTVTYLDFSPMVGYRINNKLQAGMGVSYFYVKDNITKQSLMRYGGRIFGRYYVLPNLFAHAEYEKLNGEWLRNDRFYITNILVGAGYVQRFSGRLFANIMVLWNINESVYTPYQNPIIRGGIGFGF